jgi:hypothetical protein
MVGIGAGWVLKGISTTSAKMAGIYEFKFDTEGM